MIESSRELESLKRIEKEGEKKQRLIKLSKVICFNRFKYA